MSQNNERTGSPYQAGILICETLYGSLAPVFSGGKLPECFLEVYPRDCSGLCCSSTGFREAASGLSARCSEICLLTCSSPAGRGSLDNFPGKLIDAGHGAELLYPSDVLSARRSSGDYFIFPINSGENQNYIDFLKDSGVPGSDVSRIIIPDTGTAEIKAGFVQALEEAFGLPVEVERVSLDYAENYIGRLLYEAMNRYQASGIEAFKRELSDSMVAMDMFGLLVGLKEEENVIETIIELFSVLCSPDQVVYAGVRDGIITSVSKLKPNMGTDSGIDLLPGTKMPDITPGYTGSGLLFPVSVWGEIVGLISIEGTGSNAVTESHINTARLFLPLCGLVVKNARNYNDLEVALAERDEEIILRKKAEEGLSGAIKKLNLLSGVTRHDILNQIIVANYYLESAIEDAPEYEAALNPVKKSVDEIHRHIVFTRNYQDLGILPPSWQSCPDLIRRCFEERDYPSGVSVEIDLPRIDFLADPMLGKALCNVISNAYNHAEGMKNLKISGKPAGDDAFLVTIADDGEGVPEDKKKLIFRQGHGKNHGYGLFLVKEILALTGIKIRETGVYGEGAVFGIEIPSGSWRYKEE